MIYSEIQKKEINKLYRPEPTKKIWRYMDLPKFLSLLETERLHFTRADKFEDVFEGIIPRFFYNGFSEERLELNEDTQKAFRKFKDTTFINCWSESENESYALWQIYAKKNGVAIQSTVECLQEALNNSKAQIFKVKYVNQSEKNEKLKIPYLTEESGNLRRNFFAFKPIVYKFENEVRAIIIGKDDATYKEVDIDLRKLIKNVYISPFAEKWFHNLVKKIVHDRYEMNYIKIFSSKIEVQ